MGIAIENFGKGHVSRLSRAIMVQEKSLLLRLTDLLVCVIMYMRRFYNVGNECD